VQRPEFGDSWSRQACRKLVGFCEDGVFRHVLRHILFVAPPAAATLLIRGGSITSTWLAALGPTGEIIQKSSIHLFVGAWIWVVGCKEIFSLIKKYARPASELTRDDVLKILENISAVVSKKAARMDGKVKQLCRSAAVSGDTAFSSITKPDDQLKLLTVAVHGVFAAIDQKNSAWKVRLCLVRSGNPIEWFHWEPFENKPRMDIGDLTAPSSALSRCISSRDYVVVEDMAKEAQKKKKDDRRCVRGKAMDFQGSIICAPIGDLSAGVGFVLCISSDSKLALRENLRELYVWILQHFILRFSIETSLFRLREKVYAETANIEPKAA
jgi:hypothetical protein